MSDFSTLSLVKRLYKRNIGSEKPVVGSYIDKLMNKSSGQSFDPTVDSLEAISDRLPVITAEARSDMRRGSPVSIDPVDGKFNLIPSDMTGGHFLSGGGSRSQNSHRNIAVLSSTLIVVSTNYECVAGTIDSYGVVTWGTPVTHTDSYTPHGVIPVDTTTFIQIAEDASSYPCARVGTISGNTITFDGTWTIAKSAAFTVIDACKLDTNKFVIVYLPTGAAAGYARAATISSYTITYGTEVTILATGYSANRVCCGQVATDSFVVTYTAQTTGYATAVACTVSTTTITVGSTPVALNAAVVSSLACTDSTDGSMVIVYGPATHGWIVAITVATRTITAGTPVDALSSTPVSCSPCYEYGDTSIVHFQWLVSGYGFYSRYTRTGTTLALDSYSTEVHMSDRASSTAGFGFKCISARRAVFIDTLNESFGVLLGLGTGYTPTICVGDSYIDRCLTCVGFLSTDLAAAGTGVAISEGLFSDLDLAALPIGYTLTAYQSDSLAFANIYHSMSQQYKYLGKVVRNDAFIAGGEHRNPVS